MNEKFNKNAKVEQLTKMCLSRGEVKCLIVKDPLSNMLKQKSVQSKIHPYFQYKESPCISYSYTRSVASNIFNYKASLQQIDFDGLSQNPTLCSCCDSELLYAPCGNVVTGDLSSVRNQN